MSTVMPEAAKKRGYTVRYIYAAQILLFTIRYRLQIMSTNPTEICSSRKKNLLKPKKKAVQNFI